MNRDLVLPASEFWDGWSAVDVSIGPSSFLANTVTVPVIDCARGTGPTGLSAGSTQRAQGWRSSRIQLCVDGDAGTYTVFLVGGVQLADIDQATSSARGLVATLGTPTAQTQKGLGTRHIFEAVRSIAWPFVSIDIQNTGGAAISLSVHWAVLPEVAGVL